MPSWLQTPGGQGLLEEFREPEHSLSREFIFRTWIAEGISSWDAKGIHGERGPAGAPGGGWSPCRRNSRPSSPRTSQTGPEGSERGGDPVPGGPAGGQPMGLKVGVSGACGSRARAGPPASTACAQEQRRNHTPPHAGVPALCPGVPQPCPMPAASAHTLQHLLPLSSGP